MTSNNTITILICFILFPRIAWTQSGPGGVGNSSDNILWLRGQDIIVEDGAPINTWPDTSGNSSDLTSTSGSMPTFKSNILNMKSVVSFGNNDNDRLVRSDLNNFPTDEISVFIITKTGDSNDALISYASAGDINDFLLSNSSTTNLLVDGLTSGNLGVNFNDNNYHILELTRRSVDGDLRIYRDGIESAAIIHRAGVSSTVGGTLAIGARQGGIDTNYDASQDFDGEIAEIIIYNKVVSNVERVIIENYLSTTYGLVTQNDFYIFDNSHGEELIGIGQFESTQHTDSQSDELFQLNNASSLNADSDFLFCGHDGGPISSFVQTEIPNSDTNIMRLAREYRVDLTGDPGSARITIDASQLPAMPDDYDQYFILKDGDGDFTTSAEFYPMLSVGDSKFSTNSINFEDGDFLAIAVVKSTIEFNTQETQIFEYDGTVNVQVDLNFPLQEEVTADYVVTGTATDNGTDFTLSNGTITIPEGDNSGQISVLISEDMVLESSETIILNLSNPTPNVLLGNNITHTITINDNDNARKIGFTSVTLSGNEDVSPVNATVEVSTTISESTTVQYVVSGTATGGGPDYTLQNGEVTISPNESTIDLEIPINADALDERDETIIIRLVNPSNNVNLDEITSIFTYTILDDDDEPTVGFAASSNPVGEGASPANIPVRLSTISGKEITLDYVVSDGTALNNNIDYNLSSGTLAIATGEAIGFIQPVIVDDNFEELGESFTIEITEASGANITGQITTSQILISDNDSQGFSGPGGVGDSNSNVLWVAADQINGLNDGNVLDIWEDLSGNQNDFATEIGSQPIYEVNGINGKPSVRFGGNDNDRLFKENMDDFPTSAITSFIVGKTSDPQATLISYARSTEDDDFRLNNFNLNGTFLFYVNGLPITGLSSSIADNQYHVIGLTRSAADGSFTTYKDGIIENTLTNIRTGVTSTSGGTLVIGADQDGLNTGYDAQEDFDGDIAEIIIYNKVLNDAERIIVENYLGAKYNLEVPIDLFSFENTHGFDVSGIGRASITDQHRSAQSASVMLIHNESALDVDNEYLLFGHDNGSISNYTVAETPGDGVNIQRIDREWIFDETGDLGTISITLDTTLLDAKPQNFDDYVLLLDQDGDFSSGASILPMSYGGGSQYTASGIDVNDGVYATFGVIRRIIQFTNEISSEFEPNGPQVIGLEMNFEASTTITVDYDITGGNAQGDGNDYSLSEGTLSFNIGSITTDLFVTLINDVEVESGETIEITLSNPSFGASLGTILTHTLTINDDDAPRSVEIIGASTSGPESTSPITITIQIDDTNDVDTENDTTVEYVLSGTASNGADYTLTNGTAVVPRTMQGIQIEIPITDDNIAEAEEQIIVSISNPTNSNLSMDATDFTYTIEDNDPEPTLSFSQATSSGLEAISPAKVELILSAIAGRDIAIDYTVTNGTAENGLIDYSLISGSLTLVEGSQTISLFPTIIDDSDVEGSETFVITITNVSGATIVEPSTHTFSIIDNDTNGTTGPGGVGADINNKIWLRASDIDDLGTGNVMSWPDRSGNSNDFSTPTGLEPSYLTNGINGQPSVGFSGANLDRLVLSNATDFPINDMTFVMVLKTSGITDATLSYAVPGEDDEFILFDSSSPLIVANSTTGLLNLGGTAAFNDDTYHIIYLSRNSSTGNTEFYEDGMQTGNGILKAGISLSSGGTFVFGEEQDAEDGGYDQNQSFEGELAELIVYNQELNHAQRIILDNHLAALYNIVISNDMYQFETTHGFDVVGIGQEDVQNFHLAATSDGIVTIANAQSLESGDYLLLGHDNAGVASWTSESVDVPNTSVQRLPQEWRLDETGEVGILDINVDISSLPQPNVGFDSYALLIDDDGDFSAGTTFTPLSNTNGDIYTAANLAIESGQYLAIATVQFVSNGSLDFNDPLSWIAESVPGSGQNAVISTGHDMTLSADITLGSLEIQNMASLNLNGFTLTLDVGCIILTGNGALIANGTVNYASTDNQCITGINYNNLILSGSGTKTLEGPIVINDALTISNNAVTLDVSSSNHSINLLGIWNNNGNFNPRNGTVTFEGTNDQVLNASDTESFFDLSINNSSGNLILNRPITISNELDLINGDIVLGANDLTFGLNANISNASDASYIQANNTGLVILQVLSIGTTYNLPVGDASFYTPFSVTLNNGTLNSAQLSLNLRAVTHPQIATPAISRYWTLESSGISGDIDYNVMFTYADNDILGIDESDFFGAKISPAEVIVDGSTDPLSNTTTMTGLSGFSDFTSQIGDGKSLPVELVFFRAELIDHQVQLTWLTSSELNNDFFTVEKTIDYENFVSVGNIEGAGTTNEEQEYHYIDKDPYIGVSYYRLTQTDYDGKSTKSYLVLLDYHRFDTGVKMLVFPNPIASNVSLNLQTQGLKQNANVLLKLVSLESKSYYSWEVSANQKGKIEHELKIPRELPAGEYILYIIQDGPMGSTKLIVK